MQQTAVIVAFVGVLMAMPASANAQVLGETGRWFVTMGAGFQLQTLDVTTSQSLPLYGETARVDTARQVKPSGVGDLVAGMRVATEFGIGAVGLGISGRSLKGNGAATATVPHPVFFNQARTVSGTLTDMKHSELWTSLLGLWIYPLTDKIELTAMAGPTVAWVRHETVKDATIVEANPPAITVAVESAKYSVWGFIAGVDGYYSVFGPIDVGGFFRYAFAKVPLTPDKVSVGGPSTGVSVRLRF